MRNRVVPTEKDIFLIRVGEVFISMEVQNTQNKILSTNKTLKNFLKEFDVDATDYGIEI